MRSSRWLLPALALLATACSSPKSFIVLSLQSATSTPITGVAKVVVAVSQGKMLATLTYPPPKGMATITIDDVNTTDLSVSFTGGQSGTVDLQVTVLDANGCTVGFGPAATILRTGDIASATALLTASSDCSGADGGVTADAEVDTFPGCDPVTPPPICGATQTCQVNCATREGECTAGGTGAPGAACDTNADCAPGTQCFDYSGTGCNVKVCLRFCKDDNGCAALSSRASSVDGGSADGAAAATDGAVDVAGHDASDGAPSSAVDAGVVSTPSLCAGPVQCGSVVTAYHTCTFGCDPRLSAVTAGSTRCPSGLSCLVVLGMDQVDCACAEKTRIGVDGDDCTASSQCAPGYVCNMMGTTTKCRAVCRCNGNGTTCTAPNECTNGKLCETLTGDTLFGVCL